MSICVKLAAAGSIFTRMIVYKEVGDSEEPGSHAYDHITLVASGKVAIESNGKRTEFQAPHQVYIAKGISHKVIALEPYTVCFCIHALRDKDDPGLLLDPSMVPEGTPAWLVAAPIMEPK